MDMMLHAIQDDFKLNALGDTEKSAGTQFVFLYYLTDTAGNKLTDTAGNYLVGYLREEIRLQVLHAIQDDFRLNAE